MDKRQSSYARMVFEVLLLTFILRMLIVVYDSLLGPFQVVHQKVDVNIPIILMTLDILFLGPLKEEVIYRLWVGGGLLRIHLLSLATFVSYLLVLILDPSEVVHFGNPLFENLFITILLAGILYFSFFLLLKSKFNARKRISSNSIEILISSILFSLFHFRELVSGSIFNYVLYLLPFLVLGLFLCFVRLKYGFWYSFFAHFVFNIPAAILLIL